MNKSINSTSSDPSILHGSRRGFLALLPGLAAAPLACLSAHAHEKHGAAEFRWDLIHLINGVISAGGIDSASAADGSQITLTGSGTFRSVPGRGQPQAVTGGGTWETVDSTGASTGSGDYAVTGLVSFEEVPGAVPGLGATDEIGDVEDTRAGLAVLRVLYSDGEQGVLTISCHGGGPKAAPDNVFEGITVSKGFVDYADRGKPAAGVDANRNTFHLLHH